MMLGDFGVAQDVPSSEMMVEGSREHFTTNHPQLDKKQGVLHNIPRWYMFGFYKN